jgi:glucokinase
MSCVGIDVGGTKLLVSTYTGPQLRSLEVPVPPATETLLNTLDDLIHTLAVSDLTAIGVGIPGFVQPSGTCWAPNCPAVNGVALSEVLNSRFGVPVIVDNDARLALRAEYRVGRAQGFQNVLLVAVGTGIGGSIMVDGRIIRGQQQTAGSFGWLRMLQGNEWVTWEDIASGRRLDSLAAGLGVSGGRGLVDKAREAPGPYRKAVDGWLEYLGNGIAGLASIFDPELVLISGGIIRDADFLLPRLQAIVHRQSSPATRSVMIEAASLGHQAAAVGAIFQASDYGERMGP